VRFYDDLLKDKVVAIDLIYTTCRYQCPLETARLAQVQRLLGDRVGKDIFFYSITIDPAYDTPAVLKAYAEKFHAGPGWLFLTGKAADIEQISKKLGLYSDPAATRDGHTAFVLIGDVAGGQWMKDSATDNPRLLTMLIGDFVQGWRNRHGAPVASYANAPAITADAGQRLFASRCAVCHTVGKGDGIGPDLLGITAIRDRAWLSRFIKAPDQVLAGNDPTSVALLTRYNGVRMPNLQLSDADVSLLVGYLEQAAYATGGRGRGR
jgi:protein SCO1/2